MIQLLSDMKVKYFRIEGIYTKSIYIPQDIISNTNVDRISDICKYNTSINNKETIDTMNKQKKSHLIEGLCTQGIKWAELYCTMSHLLAIYRAVYSTTATSKYALIMEDDVYIPIDTDFNALAASAPQDFGILQLMTSNGQMADVLWDQYKANSTTNNLYVKREDDIYWSTAIYLINRGRLKPVIDSIIHIKPIQRNITHYSIIAKQPDSNGLMPTECTQQPNTHICIPRNTIVADSYLYNLTSTYLFALPIAYAWSGFNSTVMAGTTDND